MSVDRRGDANAGDARELLKRPWRGIGVDNV